MEVKGSAIANRPLTTLKNYVLKKKIQFCRMKKMQGRANRVGLEVGGLFMVDLDALDGYGCSKLKSHQT